jgi:hypothetical protein
MIRIASCTLLVVIILLFIDCCSSRRVIQYTNAWNSASEYPDSQEDSNGSGDPNGSPYGDDDVSYPTFEDLISGEFLDGSKLSSITLPKKFLLYYEKSPEYAFFDAIPLDDPDPTFLTSFSEANFLDVRCHKDNDEPMVSGHYYLNWVEPWLDGYSEYYCPTYKRMFFDRALFDAEADLYAKVAFYLINKYGLLADEDITEEGFDNPAGSYPGPTIEGRHGYDLFHVDVDDIVDDNHYLACRVVMSRDELKYKIFMDQMKRFLEFSQLYDYGLITPIDISRIKYGYHEEYLP